MAPQQYCSDHVNYSVNERRGRSRSRSRSRDRRERARSPHRHQRHRRLPSARAAAVGEPDRRNANSRHHHQRQQAPLQRSADFMPHTHPTEKKKRWQKKPHQQQQLPPPPPPQLQQEQQHPPISPTRLEPQSQFPRHTSPSASVPMADLDEFANALDTACDSPTAAAQQQLDDATTIAAPVQVDDAEPPVPALVPPSPDHQQQLPASGPSLVEQSSSICPASASDQLPAGEQDAAAPAVQELAATNVVVLVPRHHTTELQSPASPPVVAAEAALPQAQPVAAPVPVKKLNRRQFGQGSITRQLLAAKAQVALLAAQHAEQQGARIDDKPAAAQPESCGQLNNEENVVNKQPEADQEVPTPVNRELSIGELLQHTISLTGVLRRTSSTLQEVERLVREDAADDRRSWMVMAEDESATDGDNGGDGPAAHAPASVPLLPEAAGDRPSEELHPPGPPAAAVAEDASAPPAPTEPPSSADLLFNLKEPARPAEPAHRHAHASASHHAALLAHRQLLPPKKRFGHARLSAEADRGDDEPAGAGGDNQTAVQLVCGAFAAEGPTVHVPASEGSPDQQEPGADWEASMAVPPENPATQRRLSYPTQWSGLGTPAAKPLPLPPDAPRIEPQPMEAAAPPPPPHITRQQTQTRPTKPPSYKQLSWPLGPQPTTTTRSPDSYRPTNGAQKPLQAPKRKAATLPSPSPAATRGRSVSARKLLRVARLEGSTADDVGALKGLLMLAAARRAAAGGTTGATAAGATAAGAAAAGAAAAEAPAAAGVEQGQAQQPEAAELLRMLHRRYGSPSVNYCIAHINSMMTQQVPRSQLGALIAAKCASPRAKMVQMLEFALQVGSPSALFQLPLQSPLLLPLVPAAPAAVYPVPPSPAPAAPTSTEHQQQQHLHFVVSRVAAARRAPAAMGPSALRPLLPAQPTPSPTVAGPSPAAPTLQPCRGLRQQSRGSALSSRRIGDR